jgi:RimJ/RimL family protein N-acetyltransferase
MLKGQKTYLRAIEEKDLAKLLQWRNQPNFRKYFREYRELNWEMQFAWYQDKVVSDDRVRMFAILDQEKELIGACGVCYINWVDRNGDFSIYIGANDLYIDDVLAIDAAYSLIRYSFEELNLHRLWAEIYDIDNAKIKMFDTLGFQLDGRHRETHWTGGHWVDSLFYSLLSQDYFNP